MTRGKRGPYKKRIDASPAPCSHFAGEHEASKKFFISNVGRRHLVKLQGGLCYYCRRKFTKRGPTRATIEHLKARMDGGTDDLSNLAAACFQCNQHRGQQKNGARQKAQA